MNDAMEPVDRLDIPKHLQYSEDHVWVDDTKEPAVLGITEDAAERMGDIVFVDLPSVGTRVEAGDELMQVESSKAVEPVISPVAGTVKYVNHDPYGEGWLVKIDLDDDRPDLLSAEEYAEKIAA